MTASEATASEHIDRLIAGLTDWRGKTLADIRKIRVKKKPPTRAKARK